MNPKELKEKLKATLLEARAISEVAEKDGNRDFTSDERQKVANLLEEAGKLKAQIKAAEGDEELRKSIQALGADFDMAAGGQKQQPRVPNGKGETLGEQFVNSSEFKDWMTRVAPSGHVPESAKGLHSPAVEFKSLFGRKTLITGDSDTSAGAFVQTDYTGIYEPLGRYPLTVRGLVSMRRTTSDLVEYVRQTTKVAQAAPVAEANVTTYAGGSTEVSGEKPEASMAWEKVTTDVKTIAVWIPATKRALSDAAQIRGIIDQELNADLEEEFEDQIVNGDGSSENFTGILNTSGILTQAWDTDILTTIRKARTAIQTTGRSNPTALVINPADAETIDLLKDDQGRYYYGGPAEGGVMRVWRVPVVESETIAEGTGLMGDFRKAVVWDREQASLQVSDSHEDFFIRNMVAFLAEMRAAFGVIRPAAFCEITLTNGS